MKVALGVNQLPTVISFHVEWRRTLYKIKKHQVKFLCFTKSAVFEKAGSSAGWSAGPLETVMVSLEAKMLDSSPGRMSYTRWKYPHFFLFIRPASLRIPLLPASCWSPGIVLTQLKSDSAVPWKFLSNTFLLCIMIRAERCTFMSEWFYGWEWSRQPPPPVALGASQASNAESSSAMWPGIPRPAMNHLGGPQVCFSNRKTV